MRSARTTICLGLLLLSLGAIGCSAAEDTTQQTPTTAPAPEATTTSTTLSQEQVTLSNMTLRQKAAQVLLLSFSGTTLTEATASLLAAGPPGGLLILGHNVADPAQMQSLTSALQQSAAAAGLPVGLFMAVDQEGGKVQRITQGVPELTSAREVGSGSTPEAARETAHQTADGLLAQGINMNLAPVADVVDDQDSFLYDRTYSGDPAVVSAFVVAVVEGFQEQGILAVVKHFPGHGSAPGNTHAEDALSTATQQEFESVHLVPFRAAISADVGGIMMAHIVATPYDPLNPASLSRVVIEGLLRGELGFQGLVLADDVTMAAILANVPNPAPPQDGTQLTEDAILVAKEVEAVVAALSAGCDLVILTELETKSRAVLDGLVTAVEQGKLNEARLDEAVMRILKSKYQYGITAPETQDIQS